ncbi:MAG: alkyl sulfatase dimerization domain-containing protein, partial [Pseudomonadota bacterium]
DTLVNSHNWPVWSQEAVAKFLLEQRDIYKYTHDQTLRLANHGLGPDEIAAKIAEPDYLADAIHARGYYGALKFNVRATYQKYYGFFDGRPVSLDPLAPEEAGRLYTDAMGGVDAVLVLAEAAVARDALQWAATILSHAVFAGEEAAKAPLAQVYRNMGYRAESGIMRNIYLSGAVELEKGVTRLPAAGGRNGDLAATLSLKDWFDAMAVRLNPDRARGVDMALAFVVDGAPATVFVARQTEFARLGPAAEDTAPTATVTLSQPELEALAAGELDPGDCAVEGDANTLATWLDLHDNFDLWFNIAAP